MTIFLDHSGLDFFFATFATEEAAFFLCKIKDTRRNVQSDDIQLLN